MEFEFDKEMDAILRRARVGEAAVSFDSHIDADEIAAFAENALPEQARARYTAHFADCARCRSILSNVITLNSEAAVVTASSVVSEENTEEQTPWYRRLFAFPQLAYTMGAFVLLFSGFFGYLILQNLSGSRNADVSRITEQPAASEKSAPSNANSSVFSAANSNAASNTASTNTTANTSSTANSATLPAATPAAVPAMPTDGKPALTEGENKPAESQTAATPAPKAEAKNEKTDDEVLAKSMPAPVTQPNAAGASREEKERDKSDNKLSTADQSTKDADEDRLRAQRSMPESPKKKMNEAGGKRSVGGKTFNNVGGIWFDAAYSNQKQKTVTRGSKDYQKLDAGLRSIAENLGGTVVVLWNGKAYRIQ